MRAKSQRLVLLLLAVGAVLGAVLLAMSALGSQASFFYAPGDVAAKGLPLDRAVRIGGMVKPGSLRRHPDGLTIDFTVTDSTPHSIQVRFAKIAPDLFREGSGVIADGRFQADGLFLADEILAKHDENYMPPELARRGLHKTESLE
ncbi:cytochrome c maturation protein CcmE [Allosphingosinicella sp.]|uniref:cytochrome c maturation protein CcmE n=1 Tax=Allosphingosinicella sp. TaxID=2823234 RepID=UPI002F1563B9